MNGQKLQSSDEVRWVAGPPQKPCPRGRFGDTSDAEGAARRGWGSLRLPLTLATVIALVLSAGVARAQEDTPASPDEDAATAPVAEPAAEAGAAAVEEAADGGSDAEEAPAADGFVLKDAIDHMVENAHGSFSVEYRLRSGDDDTDQDIYKYLDLRLGNENVDRLSATIFARSSWDLDGQRTGRDDYALTSIQDKYDSSYNVRLYTAYLTWRPKDGPVSVGRFGRQYVYAAETFHIDGAWARSAELQKDARITAEVYGGVPVHLYESSPSGDWIAGTAVSAEPFRGTRATLDYVHVTDEYEGTVRDDLTALRVWQRATEWLNLYGRASYVHGLRDAEARATGSWEEQDLMVQLQWFTLLEDKDEEFTTEFDPYYYVLHTQTEYDQYRLRAVKGFGDDVFVELGADIRDADDESTYNRDVERYYVMPTFADLLWERSELTLIGERWSGDGERIETLGAELRHEFSDEIEMVLGTDYTMYGYDGYRDRERNHVRSYLYELRWDLTESLDLRLRYVHEEDDEETYDVFTMGLTLAF